MGSHGPREKDPSYTVYARQISRAMRLFQYLSEISVLLLRKILTDTNRPARLGKRAIGGQSANISNTPITTRWRSASKPIQLNKMFHP